MNTMQKFQKLQRTVKLLPLSHYFELHGSLMPCTNGYYNIKIPIKLNEKVEDHSSTIQNEQIMIPKNQTQESRGKFLNKSQLVFIILKVGKVNREQLDKKFLTKLYWNYFRKDYSEVNLCSC